MGTVTKTIGTSSRDYSTIALWEAALPASLVTDGNSYVGQCFNDTEFNLSTTQTVIGGSTTDATHTITLTTGTGQGFKDNAGAASNALRYNQSNGVAITAAVDYATAILVSDNFVTLQNLQLKNTRTSSGAGALRVTGTDFEADNCIFQSIVGVGSNVFVNAARNAFNNCLIVTDTSSAVIGLNCNVDATIINCTVVKPSNRTANGTGIKANYSAVVIQNCAVAGFATAMDKGGTTVSGSGNAIDTASYPTGLTGQVSLTIATEFENPSNASSVMDWRLKSTSVKCKDNGTNSGAPTTDIIGQAISNTTRDAGAWELQQGGGAVSVNVTGVSSTSAVGTNTVTGFGNVPLTGVASTSAAGTPTVTGFANVSLTGVVSASQVGALTVTVGGAVNVNLTGVSAATAVGAPTLTGFANVSLTGVAASAAVGSLTTSAAANASLTGVAAISAAGAQTVTGLANVSPTGVESAGIAGDVTASVPTSISVTLAGVAATGAVGNLTVPGTAANDVAGGGGVSRSRLKKYLAKEEKFQRQKREREEALDATMEGRTKKQPSLKNTAELGGPSQIVWDDDDEDDIEFILMMVA